MKPEIKTTREIINHIPRFNDTKDIQTHVYKRWVSCEGEVAFLKRKLVSIDFMLERNIDSESKAMFEALKKELENHIKHLEGK